MEEKNIYYHYTSIDALYNIVKEKELWLFNLRDTNDPQELYYNEEMYKFAIKNILSSKNNIDKLVENINNEDFKIYLSNLLYKFDINKSQQLLVINDIYNEKWHDYYNLSLTKLRDKQLHWLQYGNKFKGVCIGINIEILKEKYKSINIDNIIYTDDNKCEEIENKIINELSDIFKSNFLAILYENYIVKNKENEKFFIGFDLKNIFNSVYENIKVFIKKKYFENEEEVRIFNCVDYDYRQNKYYIGDKNIPIPEQIFINGKIKDIIKINIEDLLKKGLIDEIILGCNCNQNKYVLEKFLDNNNVSNCKISKSEFIIN